MAAATLVSVEQYLNTSYRPDCDYIDGEILERNVGEYEHGMTQAEIAHYLKTRYPRLRWRVGTELRVQVKASQFRIPDVCILAEGAPREKIIVTAPALCVEILSPEDTLNRLTGRIKDYFEMGVPVCWVIDPVGRLAWVATPGHLDEVLDGVLRAGEIEMPLADVLE